MKPVDHLSIGSCLSCFSFCFFLLRFSFSPCLSPLSDLLSRTISISRPAGGAPVESRRSRGRTVRTARSPRGTRLDASGIHTVRYRTQPLYPLLSTRFSVVSRALGTQLSTPLPFGSVNCLSWSIMRGICIVESSGLSINEACPRGRLLRCPTFFPWQPTQCAVPCYLTPSGSLRSAAMTAQLTAAESARRECRHRCLVELSSGSAPARMHPASSPPPACSANPQAPRASNMGPS